MKWAEFQSSEHSEVQQWLNEYPNPNTNSGEINSEVDQIIELYKQMKGVQILEKESLFIELCEIVKESELDVQEISDDMINLPAASAQANPD